MSSHPVYRWTFDPGLIAALAIGSALYVRRFRAAREEAGGRGAGKREALGFAGAVAILLIALVSPVDFVGEHYLFSVHMVQHILIGDIAPLLLLLSLSRVIMRPATRRLTALERRLGGLASPLTFVALWLGLIYVWHLPPLYNAALRHPLIHALEHMSFFTAGVCLWWPLIQPVPMRYRLKGLSTFAYIAAAKAGLGVLGLYLTWSQTLAYSYYGHVPRIWGLTAIQDQNVGGATMMLEQSLVLVICLAVLFVRMLSQSEQDELRRERLEDIAAA